MKISHENPPNYDEILKYFPFADINKGTLFTYGDTCYCKEITKDLIVHEETHTVQQGNDPQKWWDQYYVDPAFRLSQELEAYQNQYAFVEKFVKDKNQRFKILHSIAVSLAGPLYGSIISYQEALKQVKNGRK